MLGERKALIYGLWFVNYGLLVPDLSNFWLLPLLLSIASSVYTSHVQLCIHHSRSLHTEP